MSTYVFTVTVICETPEQADTVMAERIGPDEDYGFGYVVNWAWADRECTVCGRNDIVTDLINIDPRCSRHVGDGS